MADFIFLIDPGTQEPKRVEPVSFAELGIKERADLEQWVTDHPELLGEPLLIVTSEFQKFDKSNLRLDVLALDKEGSIVVIELKLDASRSLADLQAVRYAAICSTMRIEDVISELADYEGITKEEASRRIREFLEIDNLPVIGNRPRIILAAGSIEDQALTSTVLWLRSFDVDISCIELTPYRIPGTAQIILVPRVIIPLAEAEDYLVNIQRKEVEQIQQTKDKSAFNKMWRAVAEEFNNLGMRFQASGKYSGTYQPIYFGDSRVHYEWLLRRRESRLDIALHFESKDPQENQFFLGIIKANEEKIKLNADLEFKIGPFGKRWAEAAFLLPFDGDMPNKEIAAKAAYAMKTLIECTWNLIEPHVNKRAEYVTHP